MPPPSRFPAPASPALGASDLSLAEALVVVRRLWQTAFNARGTGGEVHLLRTSIGLRRLTRFQDALQQATGVRVAAGVLLQLGSSEAVAESLVSGRWPPSSSLLLLRDGSPDTAMFIVAAGSGLVLELCDLATALDFSGTLWGLQLPGIDGDSAPLSSIESIARHHVDAIEQRGVRGEISLLGYSFSGLVAIEMARLLRAGGHRVELVGLLDSNCFQRYWPRAAWLRFAMRKTGRRLRELRGMSAAAAWRHLVAQGQALQRMRQRRRLQRMDGSAATADVEGPSVRRSMYYIDGLPPDFQKVRNAAIVAFEAYEPTRIDGPLVLFKSALGDQHACDPVPVWRRVAPQLDVVMVPGSHTTMVRKPFVLQLASEVGSALARVREASRRD